MPYQLIVNIVNDGRAEDVVDIAMKAGASGATTFHGTGSGAHQVEKFYGLEIEPEKELVFIVVEREEKDRIFHAITSAIDYNTPNSGIIFTIDISNLHGSKHRGEPHE